jgi:hypothetical protein
VKHVIVIGSFAGALLSHLFVPEAWRWPAITAFLFIGIIVAMRGIAAAIGEALEKKFNGDE